MWKAGGPGPPHTPPERAFGKTSQRPPESWAWLRLIYLLKQPVLVARRTPSGSGSDAGATATAAVLRQARCRPFIIAGDGLRRSP